MFLRFADGGIARRLGRIGLARLMYWRRSRGLHWDAGVLSIILTTLAPDVIASLASPGERRCVMHHFCPQNAENQSISQFETESFRATKWVTVCNTGNGAAAEDHDFLSDAFPAMPVALSPSHISSVVFLPGVAAACCAAAPCPPFLCFFTTWPPHHPRPSYPSGLSLLAFTSVRRATS